MTQLAVFHCDEIPEDFLRISLISSHRLLHIAIRQEMHDEESIVALDRSSIRALSRELAMLAEMDNLWDGEE